MVVLRRRRQRARLPPHGASTHQPRPLLDEQRPALCRRHGPQPGCAEPRLVVVLGPDGRPGRRPPGAEQRPPRRAAAVQRRRREVRRRHGLQHRNRLQGVVVVGRRHG